MSDGETMSEVLRRAIQESGLALLKIAADTGVERASISRFVRGERSLRLDMADKLAAYFGLRLTNKRANTTGHPKKGRNDGDSV
jgi:plasmid maintenance system antidote protein VapI